MKKYEVNHQLLVTARDNYEGKIFILSTHPIKIILPTTSWEGDPQALFHKHINLDSIWALYRIIDCITNIDTQRIILQYGCSIPLDTILRDAYWAEFKLEDHKSTNELLNGIRVTL